MRERSSYRLTARRRTALVALMLLPALVVRALVPVGFMPEIDGAGIHIDFCPGEAQPPGALADAGHLAQHHTKGGAGQGSPAPASHPPCLFALSGSPAFVPAAPAVAPLPPAATALVAGPSSRVLPEGVVRSQSARGPPFPA